MELHGVLVALDVETSRRVVTTEGVLTVGVLIGNIGLRDLRLSGQGLGISAAGTDESVEASLAEHDGPGVDDVIGVELIGSQNVNLGEVTHR